MRDAQHLVARLMPFGVDAIRGRAVTAMLRVRGQIPGGVVALVSHGDVIKAALAHYLALDLNHFERFDIAPCSISIVSDDGNWSQVRLVNATH